MTRSRTERLVRAVHEILDVESDPIGVGAWWVQENGRLGAKPIDLLGTDCDYEVVYAALSVIEPVG